MKCGRFNETLLDPSMDMVIVKVRDVLWAAADEVPEWKHSTTPGMCVVGKSQDEGGDDKKEKDKAVVPAKKVKTKAEDKDEIISAIEVACAGKEECHLHASRAALGTLRGAAKDAPMSLSVVAECMLKSQAAKALAKSAAKMYSRKCADDDGCLTCVTHKSTSAKDNNKASSAKDDKAPAIEVGCGEGEGNLIMEIVDAAMGPDDQLPPWPVQEGPGMCNATRPRIPVGGACVANSRAIVRHLRHACLGRASCRVQSELVQ